MTSRITIFDHFCRRLVEFSNIPTTPRSWVLNGYGRCEFSIGFDSSLPQRDQLLQERYFQFGNLVHIEHIPTDSGHGTLPSWTGIILPPQNWDLGVCHITAFSAEAILAFRAMPYISIKGRPKDLFQQIIQVVHERAKNIIFQLGQVDDKTVTASDILRTNAYDHLRKLAANQNMDFDVTGQTGVNGNLELFVNLYNQKGYDTRLDLNSTNSELNSPLLSLQGTFYNQVFGFSQAQTRQSRYAAEIINQSSYEDYGPLQINTTFMGTTDPAALSDATQAKADERGRPAWKVGRTALDYGNTFSFLNTGNIVNVKDSNVGFHPNGGYGFEKQFRITSMSYNDLSNKTPLNIEAI